MLREAALAVWEAICLPVTVRRTKSAVEAMAVELERIRKTQLVHSRLLGPVAETREIVGSIKTYVEHTDTTVNQIHKIMDG